MKRDLPVGRVARIYALLHEAEQKFGHASTWTPETRKQIAQWMAEHADAREPFDPKAAQTKEPE